MPTKRPMLVAISLTAAAIGVTALCAWLVSGRQLDGTLALGVCWLTETGSSRLVPIVLLLALVLLGTDPELERTRRRRETTRLLAVMAVALPVLTLCNERVVKPVVASPRPSHLRLVEAGIIPDAAAFARLDPGSRRDLLSTRVTPATAAHVASTLAIHPRVLEHWLRETGDSLPSGHAFSAFIVAATFLGVAVVGPTRRRRATAGALLAWAVVVSLSRVLLHVHRPVDVSVGALAGAACGVLVWALWWRWARVRG